MNKLNRRAFLAQTCKAALYALGAWSFLRTGVAWANGEGGGQPNIVLILADDLGWSDLACYGNTFVETPNIDRLAGQGMRFTDAYASCPVCSPTRASLHTGKYPARLGLTHIIEHEAAVTAKWKEPAITPYVRLEEITLYESVKRAGYATANIGKWHLGGGPLGSAAGDDSEGDPLRQGADISVADTGQPPDYFYPYRRNLADGTVLTVRRAPDGREGDYLPDRMTDEALRFVDQQRNGPFFLFLGHYLPHTSTGDRLQGKKDKIEKYLAKAGVNEVSNRIVYAAMVEDLDDSVGRVLRQLDELGMAENTLVIFASDNGGNGSKTTNLPLRGAKGELYEGGIRVPLLVRWPGHVPPRSVSHEPVITPDLYPTILTASGVQPAPGQVLDGEDLLPLLTRGQVLRRKAIFWHYPHFSPAAGSAIREGDYKLLELLDDQGPRTELYDLAADSSEQHNLAEKLPAKTKELQDKLNAWLKSVNAQMPVPNNAKQ